jgi:hypothetical protein
MTYAGVCYDGPREGKSVEMKYSRFPIAILQGSVMQFDPSKESFPPYCEQKFYRWSHPLRKWVFES